MLYKFDSAENHIFVKCSGITSTPFDYGIIDCAFSKEFAVDLLNWLKYEAPWRLKETDFYEHWEFSLADVHSNNLVFHKLNSVTFRNIILSKMKALFIEDFEDDIKIAFHKMVKGQTIRIHNDFIHGIETHRLIVQLNEADVVGGYAILFNDSNPKNIHRVIESHHNQGFVFAISERSYHAVSTIHSGDRYTIVCSLTKKS